MRWDDMQRAAVGMSSVGCMASCVSRRIIKTNYLTASQSATKVTNAEPEGNPKGHEEIQREPQEPNGNSKRTPGATQRGAH